jgi:predicted TIM-barrel fold metal-dependent hydrolase
MIVDVHTHLPSHENEVPKSDLKFETLMKSGSGEPTKLTNSAKDYLNSFKDVDKTFIFGIAPKPWDKDNNVLDNSGWSKKINHNDIAAKMATYDPKKIIPFMSLHPLDPNINEEYDRCVLDLKLRGIKLGPNYQDFDPHCKEAMNLYSKLENDNIPIIFHQGTSPQKFAPLNYAHPETIDKIAMLFPNLKMILAHLGHPWQEYCMSVVRKHKNVFADVSAQFYRPWSFWNGLNLFKEWGVMDKIFFGSDWPITSPTQTMQELRSLYLYAEKYNLPVVPEESIEGIINRDALDILCI